MLTTHTLQSKAQAVTQSEDEGSADDVIEADGSNVGTVARRAQRGKRPRTPEIQSAATAENFSEVAALGGSRSMKRHMSYHGEDVRDLRRTDEVLYQDMNSTRH